MTESRSMVNGKANRIPKLRRNLPFVQQARPRTFKKSAWLEICNLQIALQRILIRHVKDTLGNLLCCCRLAAPLWPFYQYSSLACKFVGKQDICDSLSIILHGVQIISFFASQRQPFGELANFCSASCRVSTAPMRRRPRQTTNDEVRLSYSKRSDSNSFSRPTNI